MKIEMRTDWMPIINPCVYHTNLGDQYMEVYDEYQEDFENASEAWSHFEDNAAGFTEEDEEDVPLSIEEYGVDFVFNEYADHWLTQETAMYIYDLLSIDNHRPDINKPPFIRWHLYHAPYC